DSVGVAFFGHARGRRAGAVETGVVAGELSLHRRIIEKVLVDQLGELRVLPASGIANDAENLLDAWVEEAFAQDALADHAVCTEQNGLQAIASVASASLACTIRGQDRNSSSDAATCSFATGSLCAKKTGASACRLAPAGTQ